MTLMKGKEMSLLEHIKELRRRLMFTAFFFAVFVMAGFFLAKPIIIYLQQTEEAKLLTLNAFKLTDPLLVYMQFAFIIGAVMTSPLILYQLWAFISPGLSKLYSCIDYSLFRRHCLFLLYFVSVCR